MLGSLTGTCKPFNASAELARGIAQPECWLPRRLYPSGKLSKILQTFADPAVIPGARGQLKFLSLHLEQAEHYVDPFTALVQKQKGSS